MADLDGFDTYADYVLGVRPGRVLLSFGRKPYWTDGGKYKFGEFQDAVSYAWPADRDQLAAEVAQEVATGDPVDVYVCPAVRHAGAKSRRTGDALPPLVCWVDLDGPPTDQILWEKLEPLVVRSGSDGHAHGYIALNQSIDLLRWRRLQEALRDQLGGDHKISDNDVLRLPGTLNWKTTPPTPVLLPTGQQPRVWNPVELEALLGITADLPHTPPPGTGPRVDGEPVDAADVPAWLTRRFADAANPTDRSAAFHGLVGACRDAGLTLGQTTTMMLAWAPGVEKYGAHVPTEVARCWAKVDDKTASGPESAPPDDPHAEHPALVAAAEDRDEGEVAVRKWPKLQPAAYQGVAGEIVRAVDPYTEADPAAILATLLSAFGALAGDACYALAGNDRHPARIWPQVIGKTNSGAKGTSWALVRRILGEAYPEFGEYVVNGLSSGEGLIEHVRDESGSDPDAKDFDEGVQDKRLLVVETEFSAVMARLKRESSTLGPILRQAWDGGTLRTLTRKSSRLRATDPHIVVVAHITPAELLARIDEGDLAGGSYNRYLPILSKRSKLLPDGGNLPNDVLKRCADLISQAKDSIRPRCMERTTAARDLWHERYSSLVADRPAGRLASVTARAAPQVTRLALTFAMLDGKTAIDVDHLKAALAVWDYAIGSAQWVFGTTTDADSVDLLEYIQLAAQAGRSRTNISVEHFQRHRSAAEIDRLLVALIEADRIEQSTEPTAGRPRVVYRWKEAKLRIKSLTSGNAADLNSHAANCELSPAGNVQVRDLVRNLASFAQDDEKPPADSPCDAKAGAA